jgi:hypothetical protein
VGHPPCAPLLVDIEAEVSQRCDELSMRRDTRKIILVQVCVRVVVRMERSTRRAAVGIQMHDGGLFDEYKDIYVEPDPTEDDLLSIK